jgi:hypothetical protein
VAKRVDLSSNQLRQTAGKPPAAARSKKLTLIHPARGPLRHPQRVATFIGMLEGSTRSREMDVAIGRKRDVVEAGLNEAAMSRRIYGR